MIPVFSYLKKHGASKTSTTSFLISTPQTGIDSILVTYGLLGPVFAFFRPIVAFISGIVGGVLVSVFDQENINTGKPYHVVLIAVKMKSLNFGKFLIMDSQITTRYCYSTHYRHCTAASIFYLIPPDYFNGIGIIRVC